MIWDCTHGNRQTENRKEKTNRWKTRLLVQRKLKVMLIQEWFIQCKNKLYFNSLNKTDIQQENWHFFNYNLIFHLRCDYRTRLTNHFYWFDLHSGVGFTFCSSLWNRCTLQCILPSCCFNLVSGIHRRQITDQFICDNTPTNFNLH